MVLNPVGFGLGEFEGLAQKFGSAPALEFGTTGTRPT
jgi:hypothetical protein